MMPGYAPALLQALALLQHPRGRRPAMGEALPEGIRSLLRIVAGDQQTLLAASQQTGAEPERLREAAVFYIQQVLFAPGGDSYRVLGVGPQADIEQIKEHHRWLVRWLHPDRNPDEWEGIYAERVSRAWQDLRTPERRLNHDQRPAGAVAVEAARTDYLPPPGIIAMHAPAAPTASRLRWLPNLIFVGLGTSAALGLGLLYALHWVETHPPAATVAETEPSPVAEPGPTPADLHPMPRPPQAMVVMPAARPAAAILAPLQPVVGEPAPRARPPAPRATPASMPTPIARTSAPTRRREPLR